MIRKLVLLLVRRFFRFFGASVVRLPRSPTVEDLIFQKFENAEEVQFIQVGAHDGTHNDPISLFRNRSNWRGVLLEPNPRVYKRLVKTLAGAPNCQALNVAISEKGGMLPLYVVRDPENCKGGHFSDQVSSFDREHVEKMLLWFGYSKKQTDEWIEKIQVESVTFAELLERLPDQRLDLLFIDAEGADFCLLKTFPFSCTRPSMIVFEFAHLSVEERHELLPFLSMHGYSFSVVGEDIVAVLWPD